MAHGAQLNCEVHAEPRPRCSPVWRSPGAGASLQCLLQPSARLTIEIRPWSRTIVQIRGKANARPSGWPLELVRQWAARESLRIDRRVAVGDSAALQAA
ncbi:MAG: hypothetical protein IPQ07_20745 [Myxococcales bacterium]|nr:hypothetical protein [Myxococcales bacterium]